MWHTEQESISYIYNHLDNHLLVLCEIKDQVVVPTPPQKTVHQAPVLLTGWVAICLNQQKNNQKQQIIH